MSEKRFEQLGTYCGISMGLDLENHRRPALVMGADGCTPEAAEGTFVEAGLYLVTLTRQIAFPDFRAPDHMVKCHPAVSMYHVIAQNEKGAIAQVENLAFPEEQCAVLSAEQRANLTATAIRLPLYLRGWSTQTF